jgi:UDP-glucose 4-epimerase
MIEDIRSAGGRFGAGLDGSRILVLGAAGYIGRELCARLSRAGASLRCFDRAVPVPRPDWGANTQWVEGDFADAAKVREAVDGVDYVFHLVSTTIPETSNRDLPRDLTTNVIPTLGLLEAVRSSSVKKLVFVSSGGTIYGIPRVIPIPESHENEPISGYGIHKLTIEKYLHLYAYTYGLEYCVLRLANPYSPSQVSDRPQGVVGRFVYKALKREAIEIWGDGSVVRDYIYMDDALDMFQLVLGYDGEKTVFNVGSGIGHSLMDIAGIIESQIGSSLDIRFLPARQVDVPVNVLDITRARTELGWSPRTDIRVGIQRMLETRCCMNID